MQVISENENERSNSGRTNSMDFVVCIGRISRCMEEEYARGFESRRSRVYISRRIFLELKREFDKEDKESVKMGELKKME